MTYKEKKIKQMIEGQIFLLKKVREHQEAVDKHMDQVITLMMDYKKIQRELDLLTATATEGRVQS